MQQPVPISQLLKAGRIPSTRKGAIQWFRREGIPLVETKAGFAVEISLLGDAERIAFLERQADDLSLELGSYDETAHEQYMQATASRRERAEKKAEIARYLVSLGDDLVWREREALVQERFGKKGNSDQRLKALLKRVEGIDPINFAPALLDSYDKGHRPRSVITPEAWRFFMTTITKAAPDFPLAQAHRDTRDAGKKKGWTVPSYPTFHRRWSDLPFVEQQLARYGRDETLKGLTIPARRDKTTILPLQWVSLDGRTQDYWVDFGDGRPVRPVMLALIDVASNIVLGWELVPTENAAGTVRVIKAVCEKHGIFDNLYTDNGSAFAGHLVAGGNGFRFRNGGTKSDKVQPLGICKQMGIQLTFALPTNAQAKIAERVFAALSRVIDDRPEFAGCHAGHNPGASPNAKVKPVSIEKARQVVDREVERFNRERGRRSQGANGRSYQQVFDGGLTHRIRRQPTKQQLYLAGLIFTPVTVNRYGQVQQSNWVYGDHTTQESLIRYARGNAKNRKGGVQILLGRDPNDLSAPAIAYDADGNFICDQIQPIQAGQYDSVDGIREAKRNRKAAQKAVQTAETATNLLKDQEYEAAMAALDTQPNEPQPKLDQVVAPRFGAPLNSKPKQENTDPKFLDNVDKFIAKSKAGGA